MTFQFNKYKQARKRNGITKLKFEETATNVGFG